MNTTKYKIANTEYSLAPATPRRLKVFADIVGIKSFDELRSDEVLGDLNIRVLNIGLDTAKVHRILETCLVEDVSGIDAEDIDLAIVDTMFNDFFLQRVMSSELPKS